MQLLISPVTVFSLGLPNMQVSHICILHELKTAFAMYCKDPFLKWGGVGAGSAIYNWLFFQYLLQYTIFIFFLVLT